MKRNTSILLTLIFIMLYGCITYRDSMRVILPKHTNKLADENPNVKNKLRINGFYRFVDHTIKHEYKDRITKQIIKIDSADFNLILYEDGSVNDNFFFKMGSLENEIRNNMIDNVNGSWNNNVFSWRGQWGIYSIQGDTIVMQFISRGDIIVQWDFYERKYLILNDSTLQYLSYQDLYHGYPIQYAEEGEPQLYRFIQADSIPPANPWFKKERWAWKDEEEWRKYVEETSSSE